MPAGISEQLLAKAYGPIDLSGFYKGLETASRQAAAETKAQKQALQKEYYTELASLTREQKGIRDEDIPLFNRHYNEWKNARAELLANPNLINRDSEKYGRLSDKANDSLDKARSIIERSKNASKFQQGMAKSYQTNWQKHNDDTGELLKSFKGKDVNQLEESGLMDSDKYIFKGADLPKLYNEIDTKVYKPSIVSKVAIVKEKGKIGNTEIADIADVAHPLNMQERVNSYVDGLRNKNQVANQIMSQALANGDVQRVYGEYNKMDDTQLGKIKINGKELFPEHISPFTGQKTRKPDIPTPTGTSTDDLKRYLLVKGLVLNQPKITERDKELYPDGKEVVRLQVAAINRKSATDTWKYKRKYAQENPLANEALVNIGTATYHLLNSGDSEKSNTLMQSLPNKLENGVFKIGSNPETHKNAYKAIAAKIGLLPDGKELNDDIINQIKNMSADDLSKKTGISKESLEKGVGVSVTPSRGADKQYGTAIYDPSDFTSFMNNYEGINKNSFGREAARGAEKDLSNRALEMAGLATLQEKEPKQTKKTETKTSYKGVPKGGF